MHGIPTHWEYDETHDGGELACGQLLLRLHQHFRGLAAGTRIVLRAVDEGAPLEIPAWCRLLGHRLLDQAHPFYLLVRGG